MSAAIIRHPYADLELHISMPVHLRYEHSFSVKWRDDPQLLHIIYGLFQSCQKPAMSLSQHHRQILNHLGLLLPLKELFIWGISPETGDYQDFSDLHIKDVLLFNFRARLQMVLRVPVRFRSVGSQVFDWERQREVCELIWRFFSEPSAVWTPPEHKLLLRTGLLTSPEQVPQTVHFSPYLSTEADPLWPCLDVQEEPLPESLLLTSALIWQDTPQVPPSVSDFLDDPQLLGLRPPFLWVQDLQTFVWSPMQVSENIRCFIEAAQADSEDACQYQPNKNQLQMLWQGGILIANRADLRQEWQKNLQSYHYCVIPGLLNPVQLTACRHYFRQLEHEGYLLQGDTLVEKRLNLHNERLCRFFHHQFARLISELTGERLLPSYSYLAIYHSGARLPKHIDREQCAWNLSLVLDMAPSSSRDTAWPIYLELPEETACIRLGMGDALLYRGNQYAHWRPPLPVGHKITVGFFHFVNQDFKGLLA